MKMTRAIAATAAVLMVGVWTQASPVEARNFRNSQIPQDTMTVGACDHCHVFPGGPRTTLGLQVEGLLPDPKSSQNFDWSFFFALDADGDGFTNGQELGDPDGLWNIGDVSPGQLSDPSDSGATPGGVPRCTPGFESGCDGIDNNCNGAIDEDAVCSSPIISSFSYDNADVLADGVDVQTFRLVLAHGQSIDEIRFFMNQTFHTENGLVSSGLLKVGDSVCGESGPGSGNAHITADVGSCEVNDLLSGATEYVISFAIEPTIDERTNNTVSVAFLSGGAYQTGWLKVTEAGQGFDITEDPTAEQPASLSSFSYDSASVQADGTTVQTFRLFLDDAQDVDSVLMYVNHPYHTENGQIQFGYFQVGPGICREASPLVGNRDVTLDIAGCEINVQNGIAEYVVRFVIEPTATAALNNHVSVLWSENGGFVGGWKKATAFGQGYDITEDPDAVLPPGLVGGTFDAQSVAFDGIEVQTIRISISDGAPVDRLRVVVNHPYHDENGRSYDSNFEIRQDASCVEINAGLNANVDLVTQGCERNVGMDGTVEFVLPFVVLPSFGQEALNNHISVIWSEGGGFVGGWKKATVVGQGFDISNPEPASFVSFALDQASVANDGVEVQTFRAVLADASQVGTVFFIINKQFQVQNGLPNKGYFKMGDGLCQEFVGSYNTDVALLTDQCEINPNMDGSVEYVVHFVVESGYPASTNNQVGVRWVEGASNSNWVRGTISGQGFEVTDAP